MQPANFMCFVPVRIADRLLRSLCILAHDDRPAFVILLSRLIYLNLTTFEQFVIDARGGCVLFCRILRSLGFLECALWKRRGWFYFTSTSNICDIMPTAT